MTLETAAKKITTAMLVVAVIFLAMIFAVKYLWEYMPDILKAFFKFFIGYGRGVGKIPKCGSGQDEDAGLCYPKCKPGYKGAGPVCWQECPSDLTDVGATCQKHSYGRGAGTIPKDCAPGLENQTGLCYKPCRAGYRGAGPLCWQDCPTGFGSFGALCSKPKAYGRGTGHFSKSACERKEKKPCEKTGAFWYPKCAPNFHNVGCCVCSPNCPAGMADWGAFCKRGSYGRGAGTIPKTCASGEENDTGLCYKPCKTGYKGAGPVCWQNCPAGMKDTGADCAKKSYGRGAGAVPADCPPGHQKQAGLCYPDCEEGYKGVGPMCWVF